MPRAQLIDVDEIPSPYEHVVPIKIIKHRQGSFRFSARQYLFKCSIDDKVFTCWLQPRPSKRNTKSRTETQNPTKTWIGNILGHQGKDMVDVYDEEIKEIKEQAAVRRSSLRSFRPPISEESQRELENLFGVVL